MKSPVLQTGCLSPNSVRRYCAAESLKMPTKTLEPTGSAGSVSSNRSTFDTLPDSGYARQNAIIPTVIPVSPATWWRGVKSGRYPQPVKLGERVTAWRVGDIRAYLEAQSAA